MTELLYAVDLLAKVDEENEFRLKSINDDIPDKDPILWDFLSTNMADTTMTGMGINIHYADGRTAFMKYPGAYPCCATVAQLSRRFVLESG